MRSRSLAIRAVFRAASGVVSLAIALGGWSGAAGFFHRVTSGWSATVSPAQTRSAAGRGGSGTGRSTGAVRQAGGAGPGFAAHWRFGQAPLPAETDAIGSITCGSTSTCLAIGFDAGSSTALLRSTDGGRHWTEGQRLTPVANAAPVSLAAVSCVTALRCMATTSARPGSAGTVLTSSDGGATWHADRSFPAITAGAVRFVRCVNSAVCYVFNADARSYRTGGIERTASFGGHWTTQHVTGPDAGVINGISAVSCATASACVAVAQWSSGGTSSPLLQTSNGGGTWTVRVAATHEPDLDAVGCGSAMNCMTAGGGGSDGPDAMVSTNGGVTWTAAARPQAFGSAFAVACTAARTCLLAGQAAGGGLDNNGMFARTTDLGGHWSIIRTTPGTGFPVGLSCPAASHCVAERESNGVFLPVPAGSEGFYLGSSSGTSWRKVGLPLELSELESVACPSGLVCYASGGTTGAADEGVVLRSGNRGSTWRTVLLTRRLQSFTEIACPTVTECIAVGTLNFGTGDAVARTYDAGRHWVVSKPGDGIASVTSVSCPTAAFCEAIGRIAHGRTPTRLLRSADGGRHWTVSRPPSGVAYLLGLSCPASGVCTAVGDAVHPPSPAVIIRTTDGRHWVRQRQPHGATVIDAVDCPDVRDCVAFSDSEPPAIDVTHDGGARWTGQRLTGAAAQVNAPGFISCATSKSCAFTAFASFNGAVIATANGRTWRAAVLPPGTQWLLGISCNRRSCVATGIDGQVLISR